MSWGQQIELEMGCEAANKGRDPDFHVCRIMLPLNTNR